MAGIKLHTVLAVTVLIVAGAWVATGKYSFVGSEIDNSVDTLAAAPVEPPEPERQMVAFALAQNTPYSRQLRISGLTSADKRTVLAARTAGVIAKISVEKGAKVGEGQILMALDGPEKASAVDAAEALVAQRAKVAEVDIDLLATGKISQLRADASSSDLASAISSLEMAKAEVDRMELRVPFAAIVDDVFVEEGSWVQPGTDIASIIALDPIIAVGEISERDLAQVSVGASTQVNFANGTQAEGTVRYIRREASDLTRTFPVEIAVPNPDLSIPSGMSAEITVDTQEIMSVIVPRSIITLGTDGTIGVRTLEADSKVSFLGVNIIDDTPEGLVVTGIPDGTRVVVSGQDLVTDGQDVVGIDASAAAGARAPGQN